MGNGCGKVDEFKHLTRSINLTEQWRIYQREMTAEDWYRDVAEPPKLICIDHFCGKVDYLKDENHEG